ncbi:hypothetical protein OPIT5_26710 [Opitutaceae bacterium TAV5]|nr:hypothetical protein OPIT5_26710 [Opitutaceae bacterium TAV5]
MMIVGELFVNKSDIRLKKDTKHKVPIAKDRQVFIKQPDHIK